MDEKRTRSYRLLMKRYSLGSIQAFNFEEGKARNLGLEGKQWKTRL